MFLCICAFAIFFILVGDFILTIFKILYVYFDIHICMYICLYVHTYIYVFIYSHTHISLDIGFLVTSSLFFDSFIHPNYLLVSNAFNGQ